MSKIITSQNAPEFEPVERALADLGIDQFGKYSNAVFFRVTSTTQDNGCPDAGKHRLGRFLWERGIHDYEAQELGGQKSPPKVFVDALLVLRGGDTQQTVMSMYRAAGRGDRRFNISNLSRIASSGDVVAVLHLHSGDPLVVLNLSDPHAMTSLRPLISGGRLVDRADCFVADSVYERKHRREQSQLRVLLLARRAEPACDLCGRRLPAELLVAAHIKPRRFLDIEERYRVDAVAMLACLLGCDALFERGLLMVDELGVVRASDRPTGSGWLDTHLEALSRREFRCTAFSSASELTYAWHRNFWRNSAE